MKNVSRDNKKPWVTPQALSEEYVTSHMDADSYEFLQLLRREKLTCEEARSIVGQQNMKGGHQYYLEERTFPGGSGRRPCKILRVFCKCWKSLSCDFEIRATFDETNGNRIEVYHAEHVDINLELEDLSGSAKTSSIQIIKNAVETGKVSGTRDAKELGEELAQCGFKLTRDQVLRYLKSTDIMAFADYMEELKKLNENAIVELEMVGGKRQKRQQPTKITKHRSLGDLFPHMWLRRETYQIRFPQEFDHEMTGNDPQPVLNPGFRGKELLRKPPRSPREMEKVEEPAVPRRGLVRCKVIFPVLKSFEDSIPVLLIGNDHIESIKMYILMCGTVDVLGNDVLVGFALTPTKDKDSWAYLMDDILLNISVGTTTFILDGTEGLSQYFEKSCIEYKFFSGQHLFSEMMEFVWVNFKALIPVETRKEMFRDSFEPIVNRKSESKCQDEIRRIAEAIKRAPNCLPCDINEVVEKVQNWMMGKKELNWSLMESTLPTFRYGLSCHSISEAHSHQIRNHRSGDLVSLVDAIVEGEIEVQRRESDISKSDMFYEKHLQEEIDRVRVRDFWSDGHVIHQRRGRQHIITFSPKSCTCGFPQEFNAYCRHLIRAAKDHDSDPTAIPRHLQVREGGFNWIRIHKPEIRRETGGK